MRSPTAAKPAFVRADHAIASIAGLPPRAAFARGMRRIRRAEIVGSTALAGSTLEAGEVDALLDRGMAVGGRAFVHYLLVRTYADGADWVASQRSLTPGDRRPLLQLEDIRSLHARIAAGSGVVGGAWRLGNPAPRERIVAPAAWLVAREMAALVDRFARGPQGAPVALWLAQFLGRFGRITPFENANGRTARLSANLLLRRLDAVPVVHERRDRVRYTRAVAAAEANDPLPLATLIASALIRTTQTLRAAADDEPPDFRPLRELAGDTYIALAKAAQRGRLRSVSRNGRYFTTPQWIDDYRATTTRNARPGRTSASNPTERTAESD